MVEGVVGVGEVLIATEVGFGSVGEGVGAGVFGIGEAMVHGDVVVELVEVGEGEDGVLD